MLVIGITGSFGSGKTTVARMFEKKGARLLNADEMTRPLMRRNGECFQAVVRLFGQRILTDGRIDRKKLARIVFNSPKGLKKLCNIIHPPVVRDIKKAIRKYQKNKAISAVVIDAPLLIEAGLHKYVDTLIVVKANRALQIKRIVERKGICPADIKKRIRAQLSMREKIRCADIMIDNRNRLAQTEKQVEDIWLRLSKRKKRT
ncbi:MAG: dephospho-CoA kinase [Candidatus Omnitrophota bacterium]